MLCSSPHSPMFQAEVENYIGRKWEIVRRSAYETSQLNTTMFLPSPGKGKENSAACSAIVQLFLAEEGGDSRPSIQSAPLLGLRLVETVGQIWSVNLTRAEVGGDSRPCMQSEPY